MSNTSNKQRYTQLKEWLLTIKSAPKPATRSPKRKTYDKK
jgi:hypothetical protein|tara:strand:+ start:358 stop:477 length:120 start_codon:yes stop_codon:yes gene_type:complete